MAYPKKRRGFRTITVRGIEYGWRYEFDHYQPGYALILRGPQSSGRSLVVRFRHDSHPDSMTPRLVRQAILYGLGNGWNPDERNMAMAIDWQKD